MPTQNEVHYDRPLANMVISRIQSQDSFVAGNAVPIVPVESISNLYTVFDVADMNRIEMRERAARQEAAEAEYGLSLEPYVCKSKAVKVGHDRDQEGRAADKPLDLAKQDGIYIANQTMMTMEQMFADTVFAASSPWSTNAAGIASGMPGANQFLRFDATGSDPLATVEDLKEGAGGNGVPDPNVMVVGRRVHRALMSNAVVRDMLKYTNVPSVDRVRSELASLFGVEKYIVARAFKTTSAKGQTNTFAPIVPQDAIWLGYNPAEGAGENTETAVKFFAWTGAEGANEQGMIVKRYYKVERNSDYTEGQMYLACVVVSPAMGAVATAAVESA